MQKSIFCVKSYNGSDFVAISLFEHNDKAYRQLFHGKSFVDFTNDDDSSHLRLIYCIDALNEEIHLDDISGVILFRPTVSPIIYK